MKKLRKIMKTLCSMKTALIILGLLLIACVAGSVIPQGDAESYYTTAYPGRLGWLILLLGVDDIFHCWWFAALTVFLCVNLLGCNLLHFPGLVGQMKKGYSLENCLKAWNGEAVAVTKADPKPLFEKLGFRRVSAIEKDGTQYRYAVRNKAGIWGAWLTHLGMLIIIVGFALGQIFTVKYTVYGVAGQTRPIGDTGYELTIDDFSITLREDETVEQYTASLTMTDPATGESHSGQASVNHPLSLFGMKLYQNSTGWAADVTVEKDGKPLQTDTLCAGEYTEVADKPGLVIMLTAFYPDYARGADGMPTTASPNLNNPAYLYTVYYNNSVIGMNVLAEGEVITIDEYTVTLSNPQQYTLIQVKHDPFTWLALIGGLVMMAALLLAFYLRTEELWAARQADGRWHIAGRSRKGGILFHESIVEQAERLNQKH